MGIWWKGYNKDTINQEELSENRIEETKEMLLFLDSWQINWFEKLQPSFKNLN